jgi:hypothetical protein
VRAAAERMLARARAAFESYFAGCVPRSRR